MKKIYLSILLAVALFQPALKAQTTETFEELTTGRPTTFTSNSQPFTLTSISPCSSGGFWGVFIPGQSFPNCISTTSTNSTGSYGVGTSCSAGNCTGTSNNFADCGSSVALNQTYAIQTSNSALFLVKSLYIYISDNGSTSPASSGVIFTGLKAGVTKFTVTISSGMNTSFSTNNGFTYVDFTALGGSDSSIDELEMQGTGGENYMALDNFTWCTYDLSAMGAITGSAAQCPSTTGLTYSIPAVTNATTYTWAVPTGWTITAGAGTRSITVTNGSAGQNGNITCVTSDACSISSTSSLAVTVNPATPATPGAITGTTAQCPTLTSQTYSISAVTNATSYVWTVPAGWTITAGSTTNSITVTTGTAGQNGNITVKASDACGTSSAASLAVTVGNGTPATPGSITGTATQCPSLTSQTYSISAVTNATSYVWTVPAGWTITAGSTTNSITVTTGTAGQNGNITVKASDACGTSSAASLAVTVGNGTPATPGSITGTATQCPSLTSQTYSISAVTNATTYTWAVPAGWSITAGAGTNSIIVTTGTTGQNGFITVSAGDACGTSAIVKLAVTVGNGTPATPGSITGTVTQCPSLTSQTYSISAVTNATTYTWAVPAGWSITSGTGTNTINVTTGTAGQNGNITVTAGDACGTSAAASLAVTVGNGTPATPGSITGTVTQCPSLTSQTYSISAVTNATTYTWTVPAGWSITSGTGTNTINVTAGTAGQNGNITVTAGDACGTSTAASLAVTVGNGTPTVPASISGTATQCPSLTGQTYSISTVTNATTYTWTVPAGWTITSGTGTNTINVTTGTAGQDGNITVTAGDACGTSAAASLAVTVNAAPSITLQPATFADGGCPGSVVISVIGSGAGLTYQWYSNTTSSNSGGTLISGATSSTFTPVDTTATYYYCIVGGTCGSPATSNPSGAITMEAYPSVILQPLPTGQSGCPGSIVLSVMGTGTGLAYQWYSNTTSSNSGGTLLTGAIASTYTPLPAGTTYYYCVISGPCGSPATSNASGAVTIFSPTTSSLTQTACDSYVLNSQTYTSTGTYTQHLNNAAGCDSAITLNLTINSADTSVTETSNVLTANATSATYQWLDCGSGYAVISGATSQIYTVSANGNYAVAVTQGGCTDTSTCYDVIPTGIAATNSSVADISIYPLPNNGRFTMTFNGDGYQLLTVFDETGKKILIRNLNTSDFNKSVTIDMSAYADGMYFAQVVNANGITNKKIIVQK